jgi:hypothetical protein
MTTFPESPRFKTHSSTSFSKRRCSSRRGREIKPRTVNPPSYQAPVPKSPGVPPPSRIPVVKLAMRRLRDTRFQLIPVVASKQEPTTSTPAIKTFPSNTDLNDSEMEPLMTVDELVDPRNPRIIRASRRVKWRGI